MATQAGCTREVDQGAPVISSTLWLLAPSPEGAAWVTLGTRQLCGGHRSVLPSLYFRFNAFLLESEQL